MKLIQIELGRRTLRAITALPLLLLLASILNHEVAVKLSLGYDKLKE